MSSGRHAGGGAFASRLIQWQRQHGRHDLPWQGTRDAYRIWLSEVMLQQTQVSTVIPYYRRFVDRFPDVGALAAASLDEVLVLWSGLGYYSRARNLHRAAMTVAERHAGRFPESFDEVLALPGIGRSTAGAICAFAYGQHHPILDGNVKRVLARHAGIEGWPGEPGVQAALWRQAELRLPAPGAGAQAIAGYTQALMDLGAGICARRRPDCAACPVAGDCAARVAGCVESIPAARPKKALPRRSCPLWVLLDATRGVLLEQRPPAGIWGGLWSLPQALDAAIEARLHATAGAVEPLPAVEHGFTHFRLTLMPMLVRLQALPADAVLPLEAAERRLRWVPLAQLDTVGLPAPVRTLLAAIGTTDGACAAAPLAAGAG